MGRSTLTLRSREDAEAACDGVRGRSGAGAVQLVARTAAKNRRGDGNSHDGQAADCDSRAVACKAPAARGLRDVLLIGIAGPSGVGKSTLANKLAEELNSPLAPVGMDWFLVPEWMPKDAELGGRIWETPDGVDFDRLRHELLQVAQAVADATHVPDELPVGGKFGEDIVRKGYAGHLLTEEPVALIVEGFLLFYNAALCKQLSALIWLETDCETCLLRRFRRGRGRRGRDVEKTREWFHGQVWPHFEGNRAVQLKNAPKALHLDASGERDVLADEAVKQCRALLDTRRRRDDLGSQGKRRHNDSCSDEGEWWGAADSKHEPSKTWRSKRSPQPWSWRGDEGESQEPYASKGWDGSWHKQRWRTEW